MKHEACRIALQCFANLFGTKTYRQITDCQSSDNRRLVGQQVFSGIFFSTVPQVSVTSENLTNFGFRVKLSVKEHAVHVRLSPAKSDLQNLLSARLFFLFL